MCPARTKVILFGKLLRWNNRGLVVFYRWSRAVHTYLERAGVKTKQIFNPPFRQVKYVSSMVSEYKTKTNW